MPTFQYQAIRDNGEAIGGLVFGTSLEAAMQDLQKRGLSIQNIGVAASSTDPLAATPTYNPVGAYEQPGQAPENPHAYQPETSFHEVAPDCARAQGVRYEEMQSPSASLPPGVEGYQGNIGINGPPVEQRSYFATSVAGPIVNKVSLATVSFFLTQLGTMLKAGVPMVQSLDTLSRQTQDPRFRHVVLEMKGHTEAGRPMTAGMQRYPEIFNPVTLSIIRTGEEGGFLDEALMTAARYLDDEIEIRNLYRRVTIYPKILVVASIFIILSANLIIGAVNSKAGKLSSPLTNISTWFILTPIIIGLFLFFRVGLANHRVKYIWDTVIGKLPFVGKTVRLMAMAKFGRAFGAMWQAGVPMTKIVPLSADACGNENMRAKLYPAGKILESGAGITETLRSTGALSPIVLDMLSTGERTGNLDQMLNKMADYYQDETKTRATQLGQFTGVFVFLCVAVYIGYIIISFYSSYGAQFSDMMK